MKRSIMEILIDPPQDEAEEHFENRGRRIGSWLLLGITVVLAVLSLIFPDLFPTVVVATAALMACVLWAAETFGRFVHNRRPLYLLYGFAFVVCALICIWSIAEPSVHLMSRM